MRRLIRHNRCFIFVQLQHNWSLLCYLSPALILVISCWPWLDEYRFRVCTCLHAVSLANIFLVSMIYGVHTIVIYRNILDDLLLVSVDIGTYMLLDLLLRSAKKCLASACVAANSGLSLSLSHFGSLSAAKISGRQRIISPVAVSTHVILSLPSRAALAHGCAGALSLQLDGHTNSKPARVNLVGKCQTRATARLALRMDGHQPGPAASASFAFLLTHTHPQGFGSQAQRLSGCRGHHPPTYPFLLRCRQLRRKS